ncbi:MAG TPA: hypothetical protein VHW01_18060, partial [Polyangiaceae bacterium]|nr:hypothetical protein [Polyangiaceae bacterium]
VILRCLDRDRNRRFDSIGALAVALLPFAPPEARVSVTRISGIMTGSGQSLDTQNVPTVSVPAAAGGNGTQASWGQTSSRSGRSATKVIGGIAALLAVVALLFFLLPRSPAPAPTTSSALPTAAPVQQAPVAPEVEPAVAPSTPPPPASEPSGSPPAPSVSAAPLVVHTAAKPHAPPASKSPAHAAAAPPATPDAPKNPLKMKIE